MAARPSTPPPNPHAGERLAMSPPTPEVTRRIEESRLRAKALRDQHEAEQRRTGNVPEQAKTSSGFVNTDDIQLAGPAGRKRPHVAISRQDVPANSRDARAAPGEDAGKEGADIRPARKFTKFVDYNFSAMTDTKGGFLSAEDDPHNKSMAVDDGRQGGGAENSAKPKNMTADEWERLQLLRRLQRQKAGPYEPGLSVLAEEKTRKKCRECGRPEIDWVWDEVFGLDVCTACKDKYPEKYSLLTKTECKEDYLLTDSELRDDELLPHLSRPNPHKSHWHDMMLFLRCQVEEYAFSAKKWGSAEGLDAEFERREIDKKRRKETKFKEKLLELKKKTRTEALRRGRGISGDRPTGFGDAVRDISGKHVHEWGRTVENEEGMTVKTCTACGMEVEELEF